MGCDFREEKKNGNRRESDKNLIFLILKFAEWILGKTESIFIFSI